MTNAEKRAISIFNTRNPFMVFPLGKRGIMYDVINSATGKVYRMRNCSLNTALLHYGDTVNIEHWGTLD